MKSILLFVFLIIIFSVPAYGEVVPDWVRNTSFWWADEKITDYEFTNAIEFLINNKIILMSNNHIPNEIHSEIPSWVKNNAYWWSRGEIDDGTFLKGIEFLVNNGIIRVNLPTEKIILFSGDSPLFTKFAYKNDFRDIGGQKVPLEIHLKLKPDMEDTYEKIGFFNEKSNSIVIVPIFTSTAYWEPGFYTYFRNECNSECLSKSIDFDKPLGYSGSDEGFKVLKLLNYHTVSDFDMAKNPQMIFEYEKVILLHNEYVTQEMFDAIIQHPKVVFLYPNALYAKVDVNFDKKTISLIRGHGYPDSSIDNGFDWEFDNTRPYEFDNACENWEFYNIDNGIMLNCYPENILFSNYEILKKIKDY